jgi:carbon storage regulator
VLILSRKVGDRVVIGDGVVVTVLARRGSCIRLGFEAPLEMAIVREELRGADPGASTPPHRRKPCKPRGKGG